MKLYLEDANRYILTVDLYISLQLETLNVIGKLCLNNPEIKDTVNEKLVPDII
jgi:hypothetical protein